MRFLTILISILVGMAMCAVFTFNRWPVKVSLAPFFSGPHNTQHIVTSPLWVVMFVSALVGLFFGYLLGTTSGHYSAPPKAPFKREDEVDYLLGVRKQEK